jgi:tetratricopeptide (TPR) repeat protein
MTKIFKKFALGLFLFCLSNPTSAIQRSLEVQKLRQIIRSFDSNEIKIRTSALKKIKDLKADIITIKKMLLGISGINPSFTLRMMEQAKKEANIGPKDKFDLLYLLVSMDLSLLGPRARIALKKATKIIALLNMLGAIKKDQAFSVLLKFSVRWQGIFSSEIKRIFLKAGSVSLPALIKARIEKDPRIRRLAYQIMKEMGKENPIEAIKGQDSSFIQKIILAYSQVQNPKAIDMILSFTNSKSYHLRETARKAILKYGRIALWPLRNAYRMLTGKDPSLKLNLKELSSLLFELYDQKRLVYIKKVYQKGLIYKKRKDYQAMLQSFEEVLTYEPLFKDREKIISAMMEVAELRLKERRLNSSERLFRKAFWLDPKGNSAKKSQAYLAYIQALKNSKTKEKYLKLALKYWPSHSLAKAELKKIKSPWRRLLAILLSKKVAIIALIFITLGLATWIFFKFEWTFKN